ncbi:hypothetical protein NDU88_000063 [Pleurodeles waltl]|uniref:Uncharacterized protein n=1 Tax=Pleurodeles waltl TaxID=8319 RepID=A0AAV7SVY6_PLEWA|nr:hypothetical protein NDU88_000063 [Pleurodeles waltl]
MVRSGERRRNHGTVRGEEATTMVQSEEKEQRPWYSPGRGAATMVQMGRRTSDHDTVQGGEQRPWYRWGEGPATMIQSREGSSDHGTVRGEAAAIMVQLKEKEQRPWYSPGRGAATVVQSGEGSSDYGTVQGGEQQ